jgi:hypothetical protein
MITSTFDVSFFGYKDLPSSLQFDDQQNLIPVKYLKLKYEKNSMNSSCDLFSVSNIRHICTFLGIELHRPVKGLYCIEESYVRFFDHLNYLRTNGFISNLYECGEDIIINLFRSFYA